MANSFSSRQSVSKASTSSVPAYLVYSHVQFPDCPTAYGFPQGKAQRFFYPEPHPDISNAPPRTRKSRTLFHRLSNMPKKSSQAPSSLQLGSSNFDDQPQRTSALSPNSLSPLSPSSALSSPTSPLHKGGSTIRPVTATSNRTTTDVKDRPTSPRSPRLDAAENYPEPPTPGITAIPPYPSSPDAKSKHGRDPSKSFFANLKASKSSHKIQNSDAGSLEAKPVSRGSSVERTLGKRGNGSTTELPRSAGFDKANGGMDEKLRKESIAMKSSQEGDNSLGNKKPKPRFGNLLSRSRSIRVEEPFASARLPATSRRPSNGLLRLEEISNQETQPSLKTAPLQQERKFKEAMGPQGARNRSADRHAADDNSSTQSSKRDRGYGYGGSTPYSSISQSSTSLFNNLKQTSSGAADRLGKAGKGFFGKITRSGSSTERETVTDDNYVCNVINLPLVEQTRRTRISKRLEDSKDKTEYWMPALPWRCIDYLNYKGCEEEGLYRVPGSGKEVKHWQRRFDTEMDINLFDEPELYDINTIGSMFKAWLRELPDEIFPKSTQSMIAEKCAGATNAPQLLKDELSKLPPFNYYLLFAITCHLSLLHSYVDKNKMDYRNLCICFQPCMKIDAFCFQFLVCDWKNCWQGCWTEKEHLEIELEAEKNAIQAKQKEKAKEKEKSNNDYNSNRNDSMKSNIPASVLIEERAISSSGSSQAGTGTGTGPPASSSQAHSTTEKGTGTQTQASSRSGSPKRGRKKKAPPSIDTNTSASTGTGTGTGTRASSQSHSRNASQLPELGPPLSPIKI